MTTYDCNKCKRNLCGDCLYDGQAITQQVRQETKEAGCAGFAPGSVWDYIDDRTPLEVYEDCRKGGD